MSKQVNGFVDIVVFEDIDSYVVGHGMIRALSQEIMTPNTIVVPAKATLYAFGAEMASKVDGVNVKPLQKLFWSPRPRTFHETKHVYRRITDDVPVCSYDFSDISLLKGADGFVKTVKLPATASGRMNCVLYWASIELWKGITISTKPGSGSCRSLHPLYQSVTEVKMAPPPPPPPQQQQQSSSSSLVTTSTTSTIAQKGTTSSNTNSNNNTKDKSINSNSNSDNSSGGVGSGGSSSSVIVGSEDGKGGVFSQRKFYMYRTKEGTVILSEHLRRVDTRREMPVLLAFPVNPRPAIPPDAYSALLCRMRCQAYRRGINAAVKRSAPEATVLSISSGAGLAPMFAAEAGAGCVVGTEERTSLCRAAQQVLRVNEPHPGAYSAVSLVGLESTQVAPGRTPGFGTRATVCVCEALGGRLLGSGLISAIDHAQRYLLAAGCATVPASATVYGALVDTYMTEVVCKGCRVNVSALNGIMPGISEEIDVSAAGLQRSAFLTKPFALFKFKFGSRPMCNIAPGGCVSIDTRIVVPGIITAVAIWFELDMDGTGNTILTNSPQAFSPVIKNLTYDDVTEAIGVYNIRTVWGQTVTWLPTPYQAPRGAKVSLKACYTHNEVSVTVTKGSRDISPIGMPACVPPGMGATYDKLYKRRAVLRVKLRKILTRRVDKPLEEERGGFNDGRIVTTAALRKGRKGAQKRRLMRRKKRAGCAAGTKETAGAKVARGDSSNGSSDGEGDEENEYDGNEEEVEEEEENCAYSECDDDYYDYYGSEGDDDSSSVSEDGNWEDGGSDIDGGGGSGSGGGDNDGSDGTDDGEDGGNGSNNDGRSNGENGKCGCGCGCEGGTAGYSDDEEDGCSSSGSSSDSSRGGDSGSDEDGNCSYCYRRKMEKEGTAVKEGMSYLDDEHDEEDNDDDDDDDIWNILGAITENAVELGIDPDVASEFILDLCRDF